MEPKTLYPKPWEALLIFVTSSGLTGMGIWLWGSGSSLAGVFLYILFFAVPGMFVGAIGLLPNCSYLRLGPDQFEIRFFFRTRIYQWSDVAEFGVIKVGVKKFVVFRFTPGFTGPKGLRKLANDFPKEIGNWEEGLPNFGIPPEELVNLFNGFKQAWKEKNFHLGVKNF